MKITITYKLSDSTELSLHSSEKLTLKECLSEVNPSVEMIRRRNPDVANIEYYSDVGDALYDAGRKK